MKNFKEMLNEIQNGMGELKEIAPEQMKAFHELMVATEKEGKLSTKTKHLISVALSVKSQCSYCIAFHVHGALEVGASDEEIMESAEVAVLMGGGPSLMYSQEVAKALKDLKE